MTATDFAKVENLLLKLLTSFRDVFDQRELKEVQSFIDAGEYGLALETFSDIVIEENKKITEADLDLIKELAVFMAMDKEVFHQKLKRSQK